MMQKKLMLANFIIICRKTQDKETTDSLMHAPKMRVITEIFNSSKKKCHVFLKNLRSS